MVRFNRYELAGALGDIGTDLPLLLGLMVTAGVDVSSTLIVFGGLQILMGLFYGIPMPVQPLKAMSVIMLTQQISPSVLYGAGLSIGALMLLLTVTGGLGWLRQHLSLPVIRGLQFGLGISLCSLALKDYIGAEGWSGYGLALVGFLGFLALQRQSQSRHHLPAALVLLAMGGLYAIVTHFDALGTLQLQSLIHISLPQLYQPTAEDIQQGILLLVLPQIPLSIANAIIATEQTVQDIFPERPVQIRQLGWTYGLMNLVAPLLSGIPVCNGCGGIAGFYAMGARTGGAPVLYGSFYLVSGLLFSRGFIQVIQAFPLPLLGVVLLLEGLTLMLLVRDQMSNSNDLWLVLVVAMMVIALPYGYVAGVLGGSALAIATQRGWLRPPLPHSARKE